MSMRTAAVILLGALAARAGDLEDARDRQDRPALEQRIAALSAEARKKAKDAGAHYQVALAQSYLAEVALEENDRRKAREAAEAGIRAAREAVALQAKNAEYHRILGTLCGQIIPANVLAGLKYATCARDSVNEAIKLDPRSSNAWLSHGVGNYYLPPAFGGGVELAIKDFEKAIQLDPKSAEAHLWLGIALRKAGRNAEARKALARSLELNPRRTWAKKQLEKTPEK
jgi:tetratricopeptide (TPR) repeat protein